MCIRDRRKTEEAAKKAADGEAVEAETEAEPAEKAPEAPKPINETTPLWAKQDVYKRQVVLQSNNE